MSTNQVTQIGVNQHRMLSRHKEVKPAVAVGLIRRHAIRHFRAGSTRPVNVLDFIPPQHGTLGCPGVPVIGGADPLVHIKRQLGTDQARRRIAFNQPVRNGQTANAMHEQGPFLSQ
ncbi:hypothetical protein AYM39_11130 [Methylomonas sp. DH-1]|nr:hypothetical protein AYM39_11075 [Methylomonas sp. DH-1]ANE55675.1 hypothetical protein AYM39_11130 [Methylomonas sp. DH-1]